MSYAYENNIDIMEKTYLLITEQLIILNKKIEMLEEKIDNINFNLKIRDYIKKNKKQDLYENIDWNSVHLY
jgi:hypothetical protein